MEGETRLSNIFRNKCLGNLRAEIFVQRLSLYTDSKPKAAHSLRKPSNKPRLNYVG